MLAFATLIWFRVYADCSNLPHHVHSQLWVPCVGESAIWDPWPVQEQLVDCNHLHGWVAQQPSRIWGVSQHWLRMVAVWRHIHNHQVYGYDGAGLQHQASEWGEEGKCTQKNQGRSRVVELDWWWEPLLRQYQPARLFSVCWEWEWKQGSALISDQTLYMGRLRPGQIVSLIVFSCMRFICIVSLSL